MNLENCLYLENENLEKFPFTSNASKSLDGDKILYNVLKLTDHGSNNTYGYALYKKKYGVMSLLSIEVKEDEQNKGHGKTFLNLLEKTAKKYNLKQMIVKSKNDIFVNLCLKNNFKKYLESVDVYVKELS